MKKGGEHLLYAAVCVVTCETPKSVHLYALALKSQIISLSSNDVVQYY